MTPMSFQRQRGLSLVELMVAMALSLLLMLGVIQIFLSSKQTYSTNSALSRVQESGRFAMDFLTQDIRNTGYKGQCMGDPLAHGSIDILWRLDDAIEGWNDIEEPPAHLPTTPAGTPLAGSDAILVKFAAGPAGVDAASANTATDDTIDLGANTSGVSQGAITLISDALGCDLFRNTAATDATSVAKAAGVDWSHNYTSETEILSLQNSTYFIRANDGGPNSLVRQRLGVVSGAASWLPVEELVDGIQDMQIRYGIAGTDRQVSDYVTADNVTDWDNVVAVRIVLLAVSADTGISSEAQVYDREERRICIKDDEDDVCDEDDSIDIPDRRLAQVFSTTIGIRNRLP